MNEQSKYFNIKQASIFLNCSSRTIHRKIKDNKISALEGGAKGIPYMFHVLDLHSYKLFGVKKFSKLTKPQKEEVREYL